MICEALEIFTPGDMIEWSDRPNVNFVKESVGPGPFKVLRVVGYTAPRAYHPQTVYFSKEVEDIELVYATANHDWHIPKEDADGYFSGPSPFSGYWFRRIPTE